MRSARQIQPVEPFAMSRPRDIKPEPEEPRNRLPLYPEIGFRHEFMEMIDAPTNVRRYRVTDRSVLVISAGPYGHPAGATGVHARRTAILPEAVGRRQCGSAMFAAKPHEAQQELPEGIPEPRNVTRECRRPVETVQPVKNGPRDGGAGWGRQQVRLLAARLLFSFRRAARNDFRPRQSGACIPAYRDMQLEAQRIQDTQNGF
jgi:hypothetical protein